MYRRRVILRPNRAPAIGGGSVGSIAEALVFHISNEQLEVNVKISWYSVE